MPAPFSGAIILWDGWLCKVGALAQGVYEITCPHLPGVWFITPDFVLELLGRPGT